MRNETEIVCKSIENKQKIYIKVRTLMILLSAKQIFARNKCRVFFIFFLFGCNKNGNLDLEFEIK